MFDFGWQEFIIVGFVLVMVVGPKDLPKVLRAITQVTGQAKRMANEFKNGLNDIAADEKVKEVKKMMEDAQSGEIDLIGNPLKFSKTPVSYRQAPPKCGEHNDEILAEWLADDE